LVAAHEQGGVAEDHVEQQLTARLAVRTPALNGEKKTSPCRLKSFTAARKTSRPRGNLSRGLEDLSGWLKSFAAG